jgi:hypothetical protein
MRKNCSTKTTKRKNKMKKVLIPITAGLLALTLSACEVEESSQKVITKVAEVTFEGQAERSAQHYISMMPFSRIGLIEQLQYEGYSVSEATLAVDSLNINYNEQAYKSAVNYLQMMPFSRSELIDQLLYEGYTQAQATSAVSRIG